MTPTLNWKEAAALAQTLGPEIRGLFVERVVVPERTMFPEGYLKHEWVIRLSGRRAEASLFFCIRPRHPYLALSLKKSPKAAPEATHSPFSLALSKQLKGAKVLGIEALPKERILVLWLTADGSSAERERLGLVFCMIPAIPEALLVKSRASPTESTQALLDYDWPILARSRTLVEEKIQATFNPPTGSQAPEKPEVRIDLFARPEALFEVISEELKKEAFELRVRTAERQLKDRIKQARERIRQSGTALKEAEREANWRHYGELLKATLHDLPPMDAQNKRLLEDYATGQKVAVPCDPRLDPSAQVEKFFQLARRKDRRAEEARLRIETFGENLKRWEGILARVAAEWKDLEALERAAGIVHAAPSDRASGKGQKNGQKSGKVSSWLGKTFISKDGLVILVGRSKDENLELTFKHARGNDVWLHVRGRPGAHVLVPLSSGKSAPLETLLDAAALAIYYSGGESWGKTEVDYTFKKYVKRIKDSTEASYTNNKTLILTAEAARIKRLQESVG